MKTYAFFQGCNIPTRIPQYATASRAVLALFGIELAEVAEFTCCGYPARNVDERASLLAAARNLAVAEQRGQDIAVACNCCFASLRKARQALAADQTLAKECNAILAREGLHCSGKAEVNHLLTVLHREVGTEELRKRRSLAFKDLPVAVLHGCHLLRPREVTAFDNSFVPKIATELVECSGAKSVYWRGAVECCGAALAGIDDLLGRRLLDEKISGARAAGAEILVSLCAYCYLQCDSHRKVQEGLSTAPPLPVLLLPQLLGLCFGIDQALLGIACNATVDATILHGLTTRLGPPEEEKKKRKAAVAA